MKKIYNYIIIILFIFTTLNGSSIVRSMIMPGWGEANEFKILSKEKDLNEIKYIKKRSNALILTEGAIMLGFILSNDFSKSYRNDYENYGTLYAGVDWAGKSDLFAAHVGNYNSTDDYNELVRQYFTSDVCNNNDVTSNCVYEGSQFQWDWENNTTLRLDYDDKRNKSGQLDELKTLMIAALAINRIISVFDVVIIRNKHNRSFSFDYYEENDDKEMGLKFNYHF